jgi:hypothetical protein
MDRKPPGAQIAEHFTAQLMNLTRLDAALLTMNGSPNRRTLQFATMSGNIALSDMATSPQNQQPVVLVSSVG